MIIEHIQKHPDLILDFKLSFFDREKNKKTTKVDSFIRKMDVLLPRSSLLTLYKSFVRPHLDYSDVIYYQPSNSRLPNKVETVQHRAA